MFLFVIGLLFTSLVSCGNYRFGSLQLSSIRRYPLFIQQFLFVISKEKNIFYSEPDQILLRLTILEQEQLGDYFNGNTIATVSQSLYSTQQERLENLNEGWTARENCQLFNPITWNSILEKTISFATHPKWTSKQQLRNELAIKLDRKFTLYLDLLSQLKFSQLFIGNLKRVIPGKRTEWLYPAGIKTYPRYIILKSIMEPRDEEEIGYLEELANVLTNDRFYLKAEVDLDEVGPEEFIKILGQYLEYELSLLQQQIAVIQLFGPEEIRNFMRDLILKEIVMQSNKTKKKWLFF